MKPKKIKHSALQNPAKSCKIRNPRATKNREVWVETFRISGSLVWEEQDPSPDKPIRMLDGAVGLPGLCQSEFKVLRVIAFPILTMLFVNLLAAPQTRH